MDRSSRWTGVCCRRCDDFARGVTNSALPLETSRPTVPHGGRMQDVFTGKTTCIQGRAHPGAEERARLQDDHERRLEALARLGAAAEECGLRADSDRDLILLAEDEVSLLEVAGGAWAELGDAIRDLRARLPLMRLEDFG